MNWFRKDADGKFLWPGFSENMRVLKWIVDRARGRALGRETPIGWMPRYEDIEWNGLEFSKEQFDELQAFDRAAWRKEVIEHEELFLELHDHLPPEMIYERELLICRKITDYIPEFQGGKSDIVIRNLFTHFSGLQPDVPLTTPWTGYDTGIRLACADKPAGPPAVRFLYSDINFILLGRVGAPAQRTDAPRLCARTTFLCRST